jgi:hypothetical protein
LEIWGTAHHSVVMSAFGRNVATELGLQRPVVWVGVVDMVAFCALGSSRLRAVKRRVWRVFPEQKAVPSLDSF